MTSNTFFIEFPELSDEHIEASATQLLSDYSEFSGSSVGYSYSLWKLSRSTFSATR